MVSQTHLETRERIMSSHTWLQNLRFALALDRGQRHHGRPGSHRAARHRPKLEVLEDRCLLAFLDPIAYNTDPTPFAVVTADFNGDGRLDLATTNQGFSINDCQVTIFLGDGD